MLQDGKRTSCQMLQTKFVSPRYKCDKHKTSAKETAEGRGPRDGGSHSIKNGKVTASL